MIESIVAWSTRNRVAALLLSLAFAGLGMLAWRQLPQDGIPDLASPQIVLVADWMGHPAAEVAERVTNVLTGAVDGTPGVTTVRGTTMAGMSYVDAIFASASDLEHGREQVAARARAAALPEGVRLQVGPDSASTGWVFEYALVDPHRKQSGLVLRRFQDEVLRPALQAIPGVAEVATVGGATEQWLVELEADRLRARGAAVSDVVSTVRLALGARSIGAPSDLSKLSISLGTNAPAASVRVGDLGVVHVTDDMPTGVADFRGIQPAVGGIVIARRTADIGRVIRAVEKAIDAARPNLPAGTELVVTYDRSRLAGGVVRTSMRAFVEETAVVVLVILIFLLHGRSALVPIVTLPLVLLLTLGAMWLLRLPATIMSLGGIGIALGMAVDADIVALEACHRRLEGQDPRSGERQPGEPARRDHLLAAATSFAPAILTSLCITALAFVPVLAFTGEWGRLLRPLAATKILVIGAAAIVSVVIAPALRERLLAGRLPAELGNPLTRALVNAYRPFVHFALRRPVLTLVTASLAVLSCVPIVGRLGGEFLPHMEEGDLLFMPTTRPGVGADQAATELFRQDRALRDFPEVSVVFGKVGRADTATDPAPYSMAETVVGLRPRARWSALPRTRWYSAWAPRPLRSMLGWIWPERTRETTAELVDRLDRATRLPGWAGAWTSPVRARMDMMATGVRTPVGIRVVATQPARLEALGSAVRDVVMGVPGTRSAVFEPLGGQPWLTFAADAEAAVRLHVEPEKISDIVHLLRTGGLLGEVSTPHGPARIRITPDADMHSMMMTGQGLPLRGPADQMRAATVRATNGPPVPLALLGRSSYAVEPAQIRTEQGHSVAYVYVDLAEGVDLAGYVRAAQRALDGAVARGQVQLQGDERIEQTGEYELLLAGQKRLRFIAPLVMVAMLGLLWLQFRSVAEALIVLVSVPFALVGSTWTLWALSYPLSAPVWAGILSTVGLAMQTGVVMVVYIDEAFYRRVREGRLRTREDIVLAHAEGTVKRLRPKIMTVATMAATLLPLLWADGPGAEVIKRVAAPMLGGLATSALLTLEVLPVIYTIWRSAQLAHARRAGVPIEAVVGRVPRWVGFANPAMEPAAPRQSLGERPRSEFRTFRPPTSTQG